VSTKLQLIHLQSAVNIIKHTQPTYGAYERIIKSIKFNSDSELTSSFITIDRGALKRNINYVVHRSRWSSSGSGVSPV